ncbi:MAG TPA: universal stress protein [Pirellulales bacterium]|nr:universal stress protein [Pirellulales bacterium]
MSQAETVPEARLRNPADIPLQTIGVATDFSETAGLALSYGAAVVGQFGGSLHVLHVLHEAGLSALHPDDAACFESARGYFNQPEENGPQAERSLQDSVRNFLERVERGTNERLQTLTSSALLANLKIVTAIRYGSPVDEICDYVRQNAIDLLVLGTHGHRGINHFLIGSVAERVVRASPCPVLTVRLPRS